jgi:hypothetical protein
VLVYLKKELGANMETILHVVFYLQWNVEAHAKDYRKVAEMFFFSTRKSIGLFKFNSFY